MDKVLEGVLADLAAVKEKNEKVVKLGHLRNIEDLFDDMEQRENELRKDFGEIYPVFWIYMKILEFAVFVSELLWRHPMLRPHKLKLERAQKKYFSEPSGPICDSIYHTWKFLDAALDDGKSTIVTLIQKLDSILEIENSDMLKELELLQNTRNSFYTCVRNIETEAGQAIVMRELFTDEVFEGLLSTPFECIPGEIMYARFFPDLHSDKAKLLMSTPYILKNTTEEKYLDFLASKQIAKESPGSQERLHDYLKFGTKWCYWLDYIQKETIGFNLKRRCYYLSGLPKK